MGPDYPICLGPTMPALDNNGSRVVVGTRCRFSDVVVKTKMARPSKFVTEVMSISDDRSRVDTKLCTGRVIDVPVSILQM